MNDLPVWVNYVAALTPLGTLLAVTIASIIAWRSHARQKQSDAEERLWHRLTWAVDRASGENVHDGNIGLVVLTELVNSRRTPPADLDMLAKVTESLVERMIEGVEGQSPNSESHTDPHPSGEE